MRIAVCVKCGDEQATLVKWIGQYCDIYGVACTITTTGDPEELLGWCRDEPFQLVFLGLGGQDGLLATRRLREMDKNCAIVMIDDTAENAVKGVRLHVADYMVRPVEFKKLVRAMKLALAGVEA